jgi:hypothetical protein
MKNSSDTIGNRSRDLPVCSTVPQPLCHRVPHIGYSAPKKLPRTCGLHMGTFNCSKQVDVIKLGINPYCSHIMQDLRNDNEEERLSFMWYTEDKNVQQ